MQQISLYYREGSSDKEYHVEMTPLGDKFQVNVAYGRRGSTLSTGTKTREPVDLPEANRVFSKLIREKKAKGYTEGATGTPYQHAEEQPSGLQCQLLNPVGEEQVSRLIDDDRWCMQEKRDGRRMLLQKEGAAIHGINRRGWLTGLPSVLIAQVQRFDGDLVIDGECVGEQFFAFDLLQRNGVCQRTLPYEERFNLLTDELAAHSFQNIELVETAYQAGEKLGMLQRLQRERREGVVFKQLSAPYTAGRPSSGGTQLKHKFYATASVVVTKVNPQRSVEMGLLDPDGWKGAGNVTIPANQSIPKPGTVVEVRYLYAFRASGCLYQPTYLGARSDITPMECLVGQLKFKADGATDEEP